MGPVASISRVSLPLEVRISAGGSARIVPAIARASASSPRSSTTTTDARIG
jgi:hypothetical protein